MTQRQQLTRLATITETALSAAQSKMMKINRQEAALRQQIVDLNTRREAGSFVDSPAYKAGADVRWQRWVDSRRVELNLELARVLAKKEALRADLKTAFGKNQAMQTLLSRF